MMKLEEKENFIVGLIWILSLSLSLVFFTVDFLNDDFYIVKIPFLLFALDAALRLFLRLIF